MSERIHDASMGHPGFPQLSRLINDGRWDEFEAAFAALEPDQRHVILSGLAERSAIDDFRSWPEANSRIGSLVRGTALITHAWRARTALAGKYVSADGARGFFDCLNQSFDHLITAHQADPGDPEPLARLFRVLMGLDARRDEIYECHDRLAATGQYHLGGSCAMVEALAPKWGGDEQEMLSFARTQANADTRKQSLIAYAHIENWVSLKMGDQEAAAKYFERADVREDIALARESDNLDVTTDYFGLIARSIYAVCFFKMKDKERTLRELSMIGDRYPSKPWVYVSSIERTAIDGARTWCGLPALAPLD